MPISDMEPPASFGSDTRVDTFRQPPSGDHYTRSNLGHPSGSTGEPSIFPGWDLIQTLAVIIEREHYRPGVLAQLSD